MDPTAASFNPALVASLQARLESLNSVANDLSSTFGQLEVSFVCVHAAGVAIDHAPPTVQSDCVGAFCSSTHRLANRRSRRLQARLAAMFSAIHRSQKEARDAQERGDHVIAAENLKLGEGTAYRLEIVVQEIGESVKEYSRIGQRAGSISSAENDEPTESSAGSSVGEEDDDESVVFILERPGTGNERDRRWTW